MAKVVTMQDYLHAKRMSGIIKDEQEKANKEKKERIKRSISFFAGIILYWIACFIIAMGFFAVALYTL